MSGSKIRSSGVGRRPASLLSAAAAVAVGVTAGLLPHAASAAGVDNTLFLHHFDSVIGQGAGAADYANGSPNEQVGPPNGPGGTITGSNVRFGPGSLDRSSGGRIEYDTAGNWDASRGTIEMWVYGPGVVSGGFRGLWGTDTSTGNGADIRMYIYDTGAGRTLGAYMAGGSGTFWEIEQAIPAPLLTDNQWHHVAWSYDTTLGQTATWWDGQLLRNTPDSGVVNFHNATNTLMHVGENQAGSAPWPGMIDELRISDVVRYNINGNFTPPTQAFAVPEPASAAGLALFAAATLVRGTRRRRI